jgi:hypothetical protein
MRVTFQLTDGQYAANDRAGVLVGLPLSVQLDAGLLAMGHAAAASGSGWFERAAPGRQLLKQISLERYAFSGRLAQIDAPPGAAWRGLEGVVCQALLECGLPLRLDVLDPDASAAVGAASVPYGLKAGDWLLGVASLQGLLALDYAALTLAWRPVEGAIVDIQRLSLSPFDPGFGTLRWLHGLPARSFAPDVVYVTIDAKA